MTKYGLLILLLIKIQVGYSQHQYPKGTLLVALICNDGILMAADSRASFMTESKDEPWNRKKDYVYAYTDSSQKIFDIGNFKIAIAGLTMFAKTSIYSIMSDFKDYSVPPGSS